ncbi:MULTISPECIES: GNAT family N-acetyltransferase [Paenibacillus]|jgi:[ribosomal protein S18]-alanine N-acetyltransferase|uniref:GNAT family N-acetyltransferase n=1 Tax=Paenibacillus TaxID=44249 RepID=UPI0004F7D9B2|nr:MULTISPECIES: GNAT family N-acetyltransferase [unclassified Paenibacillus]AIQ30606.1 acetyltransferase [Paenibacillus sp. FSL P4-0081]OMF30175.1 GNAT family N-acetyltransferase [Paenibacillus sp. FSL H8-0259]
MAVVIRPLTQLQAEDIAYHWHYAGEYSFYDMDADEDDLIEFLDPAGRGDHTYAVSQDDEFIGYFTVQPVEGNICDIGLGMRPDLTGRGAGQAFLKSVLHYVTVNFHPERITLAVATFNARAIKVYLKAGFTAADTYMQNTNGSTYEFMSMVYKC